MFYYVECGTEMTLDYGDMDEAFYSSLESMFDRAIKQLEDSDPEMIATFLPRAVRLVRRSNGLGWGYYDYLSARLYDSFLMRLLLRIELEAEAEGARRLEHVSDENIGRRMALVVDGRVRSAPVIRSPVGRVDVRMIAAVEVRGGEAQRLAELIRARWAEREGSDESL